MAKGRRKKLAVLKITCTSSDCENGLHCYKPKRKAYAQDELGNCRSCGEKLHDFMEVRKKKISDVKLTFDALKHEMWRHHYWHIEIDQIAVNHARRKGMKRLADAAQNRITKSLKANNDFDGLQTPKTGNAIYYAQHATATCCRGCLDYWHGIPRNRALTAAEVEYAGQLVMRYIEERMPYLTLEGEKVPHIRKKKGIR